MKRTKVRVRHVPTLVSACKGEILCRQINKFNTLTR